MATSFLNLESIYQRANRQIFRARSRSDESARVRLSHTVIQTGTHSLIRNPPVRQWRCLTETVKPSIGVVSWRNTNRCSKVLNQSRNGSRREADVDNRHDRQSHQYRHLWKMFPARRQILSLLWKLMNRRPIGLRRNSDDSNTSSSNASSTQAASKLQNRFTLR